MDKRYSFAIPIIVGCAQFMHQFDGSVIATALPAMAQSMHEDPLRLNLAISTYLLALAVFVPISGWMADRFGARRIFMLAIVIFTISSVLCGVSHTLLELVLSRILQGFGGAMMTPVGRVVVAKTVPRADLVKAMQYITIPGVLAPVLGPSVGGFIVSYVSWPWIFFVNVPIGVAGVFLVRAFIPDLPREKVARLDFRGFALAAVGLACLVFSFESMGRGLLPFWAVVGMMTAGISCAGLYVLHARRTENPIIDFKLLSVRTFAASVTGGSMFYITTSAVVFILAMLLQVGFGLSAFNSGLILLGVAAGSVASRIFFRPLLKLFGFRRLLIVNAIVWGVYLFTCGLFTPETPRVLLVSILFVGGVARSMQYSSVQSLSYADMPRSSMSGATTFSALSQQITQSFGVGLTALTVHFALVAHGHEAIAVNDLRWGFWIISASSFLSLITFLRLPQGAGASLEGSGGGRGTG